MVRVDAIRVRKILRKLPRYIVDRFNDWVSSVEKEGIWATRMTPGYHDEPLKGQRLGQRSVRLTRSYRIIYTELSSENIEIILVLEVNKHDY